MVDGFDLPQEHILDLGLMAFESQKLQFNNLAAPCRANGTAGLAFCAAKAFCSNPKSTLAIRSMGAGSLSMARSTRCSRSIVD